MKSHASRHDPEQRFSREELAALSEEVNDYGNLPWQGSPSRLVMMPVDPGFMHVYWHISRRELSEAGVNPAEHHGRYQLHLTPVENGVEVAERGFSLAIQGLRGERRVWLPPGNRTFKASLQVEASAGDLALLAYSEPATLPHPPVPPASLLAPIGAPVSGLRPETTPREQARAALPEASERTLDDLLGGVPVVRKDFRENGVYFDEALIDRFIQASLSERIPGVETLALLREGMLPGYGESFSSLGGASELSASGRGLYGDCSLLPSFDTSSLPTML